MCGLKIISKFHLNHDLDLDLNLAFQLRTNSVRRKIKIKIVIKRDKVKKDPTSMTSIYDKIGKGDQLRSVIGKGF